MENKAKFPSLWVPRFFGLNSSYREHQLEEVYLLMQHAQFAYTEARELPIPIRRWFLDRVTKDFKKRNEAIEKNSDTTQVTTTRLFGQNS